MKTKSIIAALLLAASSAFAQVPSNLLTSGHTNNTLGTQKQMSTVNDVSVGYLTQSPIVFNDTSIWHYIALTKSNSIGNFYLDGNLIYSGSFLSNPYIWNSLLFGATQGCVSCQPVPDFNGKIDEVRVSNIARSNSSILNYFQSNSAFTADINTIGLFNMDNISGNSISNLVGGTAAVFGAPNLTGGKFGQCIQFDGNDDYVRWSQSLPINNLTVEFWFKSGDLSGTMLMLEYAYNTGIYIRGTINSHSINSDGPTTFCAGNYVNLTSDIVGGSYQWKKNGLNISTNGTSRTYKATTTGSYTCVATLNGNTLTSNAIAVTSKTNAAATVSATGATSFCAGDSVTLNATNLGSNYSVQWYRTNVSMDNATNYSQVVKQPGTYKVVTKNLTNGCSRISGSSAIVAVSCRIAGDISSGTPAPITESEAKFTANDLSQGVNIFPNPNNGSFTFAYDGEEYGDAVLQVMNSMGQMIYTTNVNVNEGGYTQELQLGDNSSQGIYIVRLIINGHSYDSRVLVR
jgi:hypothetical protein